ncbi:MAG: HD domain-containing protein, partial [Deltaproteobacteria bacterium]|nr:HD domain-containing protein [Deltaproteobacteria bacterium]
MGAAFVMRRFLERVAPLGAEIAPTWALSEDDAQDALAAALLHDVGHGPLSHLFEEVFPAMRAHEAWTSAVVLDPGGAVPAPRGRRPRPPGAGRGARARPPPPPVPRQGGLGHLRRRPLRLPPAQLVHDRHALRPLRPRLAPAVAAPRARPHRAAPRGRRLQGPPRRRGILPRAGVHVPAGVLPQGHARGGVPAARGVPPLRRPRGRRARPRRHPAALSAFRAPEPVSVGAYLSLDDNTFWCAVDAWRADRDPVLAALCDRAMGRVLPKTASLDEVDPAHDALLLDALRCIVRAWASFDVPPPSTWPRS